MDILLRDLRYAFRGLTKNRAFAVVALLSLGLGVGLNTAVFSFIDAVLLRPFPYEDADRLALIWGTKSMDVRRGVNGEDFENWRSQSRSFGNIAVFQINPVSYEIGTDHNEVVRAGMVGTRAFSVLGARPMLGSTFSEIQSEAGGEKSVILSYGLWKSFFAGEAAVVGKSIQLNGQAYIVVGVMPPEFFFPDQNIQLWVPLTRATGMFGQVHGLVRLRPGVTLEQAQVELDTISKRTQESKSVAPRSLQPGIFSLYRVVVGKYERALWTLLAAVTLLLLIACANVSNLLLARGVGREKELAVRVSFGASAANIFRLLLSENILLSLAAGGLGVLGAWWGVLILRGLHLADIPRFDSARIDLRVLLFAACVSTVTGILSGLIPAWKAARPNLLASLQLGGMSTYPRGQGQLCNLLVTIEVAVAIVLLAGAGLLINSFVHLTRADWGFNPDHLLLVPTNLPRSLDKDFAARIQFNEDVVNRLARVPGVASSAMAYGVPIKYFWSLTQLAIGGRWVNRDWEAATWIVGPEYFRTMQIPLLRGREFNVRDDELAQRAVVVSKKLADQLWPGTDPIRKQFGVLKLKKDLEALVRKDPESSLIPKIIGSPESWEPDGTPWQVVGEVGNVRAFGLDSESQAALYIDYQQRTLSWASEIFVVRTSSAPLKLAPAIKRQIMGAEKRITFGNISSMSDLVSESIGGRGSNKLLLVVSSLFGSLSLLIASVGIYGVVAFSVAQRTREIGIRRTLGAKRGEILRMVIVQSLRPVFFGLLLGLANSFVVTRLLKGLLFGVTPTDPFTFLSISVLLVVAACAACMSPPLRALRVDPSECLRYE